MYERMDSDAVEVDSVSGDDFCKAKVAMIGGDLKDFPPDPPLVDTLVDDRSEGLGDFYNYFYEDFYNNYCCLMLR